MRIAGHLKRLLLKAVYLDFLLSLQWVLLWDGAILKSKMDNNSSYFVSSWSRTEFKDGSGGKDL